MTPPPQCYNFLGWSPPPLLLYKIIDDPPPPQSFSNFIGLLIVYITYSRKPKTLYTAGGNCCIVNPSAKESKLVTILSDDLARPAIVSSLR